MRTALIGLAALAFAGAAQAQAIPNGGLTLAEVATWLQGQGYASERVDDSDGTQHLRYLYQGVKVGVYMFDCSGARCGSLQLSAGWATHGRFDISQMNRWNRDKRWCRGYFDAENDPWIERDVDLTPGASFDTLKDETFDIFKNCMLNFKQMYDL